MAHARSPLPVRIDDGRGRLRSIESRGRGGVVGRCARAAPRSGAVAVALDAAVAVRGASDAKGLECDHVVVAEPAQLIGDDDAGLRLLYTVLTRATQRLVVVHSESMPEPLANAAGALGGAPVAAS